MRSFDPNFKPLVSLHICHISVLNPSLHPRMFYKIARSQKKMGYQVSVMAQDERKESYQVDGIDIYPLKPFHRLSLRRFLFSFLHLGKLNRIRADAYVIHSPELLFLAYYLMKVQGAKLIYDVHEDYAQTFEDVNYYRGWLGQIMSSIVRKVEKWMVKRLHAVSYAEECYENILEVPAEKKFFLRNRFVSESEQIVSSLEIPYPKYMVYTGSLAGDWGIFRSLDLWEELNQIVELPFIMAGITPRQVVMEEIDRRVKQSRLEDRFTLIGGRSYVPYADILALIKNCLFGTGLYAVKPYIDGKLPTKFYEYLGCNKPLIYTPEEKWHAFNQRVNLGFSWQKGDDVELLWNKIIAWDKEPPPSYPEVFSWANEEKDLKKMLTLIETS